MAVGVVVFDVGERVAELAGVEPAKIVDMGDRSLRIAPLDELPAVFA